MLTRRDLGSVACVLATTVVVACSGDVPTSPAKAVQSLTTSTPTIGLIPTSFRFCIPFSGGMLRPCGSRSSLAINNVGGGTLNWHITKTGTWLRISPRLGAVPANAQAHVQVWVVGTGVPAGIYHGQIKVWGTGATNSPQTVPVQFTKR